MRLAVYTDYLYRRRGSQVVGERAFVLFLNRLAEHLDELVLLGRLDERPGGAGHYAVSPRVRYVPLPFYASAARPREAAGAWIRSLVGFWRSLESVDAVWLLGPHPLCFGFAALAAARRRKVVLGVRQNTPSYSRARHPHRRWVWLAADLLDAGFRLLGRRFGVIVVGPELSRRYGRARDLLEISVSLVDDADLGDPADVHSRDYSGPLKVLSVGRLDTEKNPLLLADVLLALVRDDPRWRLVVCGEGPLEPALRARFEAAGLAEHVTMAGYVALDGGLLDLYRECHMLLHVSLTEGVPQVLYEAFAAVVPVVATAVGGVEEAAAEAALLIPPADAGAAVEALKRLAADPALRERITAAGVERVRPRTLGAESARVASFIARAR